MTSTTTWKKHNDIDNNRKKTQWHRQQQEKHAMTLITNHEQNRKRHNDIDNNRKRHNDIDNKTWTEKTAKMISTRKITDIFWQHQLMCNINIELKQTKKDTQ
jgi:hypothetical protein